MRKSINFISLFVFMLLLVGCSSVSYFYQVYETSLPQNVKMENSAMYYEDENCKIIYDFWNDGGDIGFSFYNKTNNNLYINLEESFFIKNGVAYDYYQNRIYQQSNMSSSSTSNLTSVMYLGVAESKALNSSSANQYSEYSIEQKVVCIPPKTSKYIKEYKIVNALYRSCSLLRYPSKQPSAKFINKEEFTDNNSPLMFGNVITYSFKNTSTDYIRVNNTFVVKSIANYRDKDVNRVKKVKYCNEGYSTSVVFTDTISTSNNFYIKYSKIKKDEDTYDH